MHDRSLPDRVRHGADTSQPALSAECAALGTTAGSFIECAIEPTLPELDSVGNAQLLAPQLSDGRDNGKARTNCNLRERTSQVALQLCTTPIATAVVRPRCSAVPEIGRSYALLLPDPSDACSFLRPNDELSRCRPTVAGLEKARPRQSA